MSILLLLTGFRESKAQAFGERPHTDHRLYMRNPDPSLGMAQRLSVHLVAAVRKPTAKSVFHMTNGASFLLLKCSQNKCPSPISGWTDVQSTHSE